MQPLQLSILEEVTEISTSTGKSECCHNSDPQLVPCIMHLVFGFGSILMVKTAVTSKETKSLKLVLLTGRVVSWGKFH